MSDKLSNEITEKIDSLNDKEKLVLLAMTMESVRGSWHNAENRISVIEYLVNIPTLLKNKNASQRILTHIDFYRMDSSDFDGRTFRDDKYGYHYIWHILNSPSEVNDNGVKQSGMPHNNLLKEMKKIYTLILSEIEDLTWGYLFEEDTQEEENVVEE